MVKRILIGVAAVIGLFAVVVGLIAVSMFSGLVESKDGPVAPGVQLVRDGYVNAFFIDAGDGVALIDCGNDVEAKAILAALKARNLDATSVKAIFLTHGHPDHTAGCKKFPAAAVYAFPAEKEIVEGRATSLGLVPKLAGVETSKVATVTNVLEDGATVTIGTASITAWTIPGHTAGSAAYLANGVLFLGDAATAETDGELRNAPWIVSDDTAVSRASVMALANKLPATVTHLAFSHSGSMSSTEALKSFGK